MAVLQLILRLHRRQSNDAQFRRKNLHHRAAISGALHWSYSDVCSRPVPLRCLSIQEALCIRQIN